MPKFDSTQKKSGVNMATTSLAPIPVSSVSQKEQRSQTTQIAADARIAGGYFMRKLLLAIKSKIWQLHRV